jgi:hypothetical protein
VNRQIWLSCNLEFFGREGVRSGLLIELVERRPKGKQRCDPLNDLAEPPAFIIGQRPSIAPIGLPVAEPLL